jgi:hypothetical protein
MVLFSWMGDKSRSGVSVMAWAGEKPFLPSRARKEKANPSSIAQRFLGERLHYYLGVFWFTQAADCIISFQEDEACGHYVASMWAKTRGFIGWLTSYRENRYVSYMEEVDGGRRLRPMRFEKTIIIGKKVNQSFHWFDYQQGRIDYAILRNHQLISQNCDDLPPGVIYEDILSAFYNFRAGVFGKIRKGQSYLIPAIPKQGIDKYTAEVLDGSQERKQRRKYNWEGDSGFVLKIKVDKEIFGTRDGLVWAWMSKNIVPLVAVAEDAIGLGDITGRLNRVSYLSP